MEPQFSVLLYSKYSSNCKRLMDLMKNSQVDIDSILRLQHLCVDNPKVRERIKKNNQIDVTIVPCILCVYPNGGVEKFDGAYAFNWIENIISKLTPPPPPQQTLPEPIEEPYEQPQREQPQRDSRSEIQERFSGPHSTQVRQKSENEPPSRIPNIPSIPSRMKPINNEQQATSIEDIPYESESDRHRNIQQPPRIRQGNNDYIEEPAAFQGETPSIRRPPRNVVRTEAPTSEKTSQDPHGTMARAKALAQGREVTETEIAKPSERPIDVRIP